MRRALRLDFCSAFLVTASAAAHLQTAAHDPAQLFGTWHGRSVCTDLVAAPAYRDCRDETVVYEFAAGTEPGTVHWPADKIVNGRREPMGELELELDEAGGCWKAEFQSPRAHVVWCLKVAGTRLSGTAWLLPGKEKVRVVDVEKEAPHHEPN